MNRRLLFAVFSLLAACDRVPKPPEVVVPELPGIELPKFKLPVSAESGQYVLIQASSARLEIDPTARDAVTAVGTCTDLVSYCVSAERSLDSCVASARGCETARPWNEVLSCCPKPCQERYAAARAAGTEPLPAFEKTFFLEPGCFPGLAAALEVTP